MFFPLSICAFFSLGFFLYSRIYRLGSIDYHESYSEFTWCDSVFAVHFKMLQKSTWEISFYFCKKLETIFFRKYLKAEVVTNGIFTLFDEK